MSNYRRLILSCLILNCLFILNLASLDHIHQSHFNNSFVIAVHGGAGSYFRSSLTKEKEVLIKQGLLDALTAAFNVLSSNGTHVEAAKEAIIQLEDNPLFNAGKGGKLNQHFEVELDASIMDGSNLNCGAVAAVKHIKNPIKAAEAVMHSTPHILLVSQAADDWAKDIGLDYVPNYHFFTMDRIAEWFEYQSESSLRMKGTVGCVVKDSFGHLSAATSTGGISNKMPGRVGDSPLIGAGNYANDESCAVSCTGTGEVMMRRVMAFDIHARMVYKGLSLKESTEEVLSSVETDTGGFIAVDKNGNLEMPYNSGGMARAYVRQDGKAFIYIFNEGEDLTPVEYDIKHLQLLN